MVVTVSGVQTSCGPEKTDDSESPVATETQAVIRPFTLSLTLPAGVELNTMAAAARLSLNARDRTQIQGPMGTSGGPLIVDNDAKVRALTARGAITIRDRTVVTGNVRATGTVTRSPSAVVNGTVQSGQNIASRTVQWTFQVDDVSSGDVILQPDQRRDLLPGSYGTVSVGSRAKLTLHTGVYRFGRITVEPQGKLLIDSVSGPVQAYFTVGFTFRGAIESARFGLPQLLLGHMGTETVFIEAPFTGVLIAPNADVRVQAARPQGHDAVFYGKTLTMEPDTIVRVLPFTWGGIDPSLQPPPDPTRPVATMPRSPVDIPVSVGVTGTGTPTSSTDSPSPVGFNLPTSYPLGGGEICNSTVTFRFRQGTSPLVTCTYRGGSTTSTPTTEPELNAGRTLHFQSCSDGLPASTRRTANHFELSVTPCPGFAVTVNPPVVNDNACSEQLELLTVEQTRQMRQSFTWAGKQKLQETNPDGTPALYYAWVLIRNKTEALALKQLRIHVLTRPLFADELNQFAGKCGAITNPGDGQGTFVPVVIPGGIYNGLIEALTSGDIAGPPCNANCDRVIFDAVIIRQVPAASRNANGSIRVDQLINSGFKYLHYEKDPLADFHTMELDGASKLLVAAMDFVGELAVDVGEFVLNRLGDLSRLFLGTTHVDLHLWVTNRDPHFPGPVAVRGWGPFAGRNLGAPGLQVTVIQPFLAVLPIPATSMGNTDMLGHVHIEAFESPLGAALCIETKNDAALVTDFMLANEVCDFRGLTDTSHRFWDMTNDKTFDLQVDELRLTGLYQATDVFEWDKAVGGFEPKRARIISGAWGDTITSHGDDGESRLYAPCLNFGNTFSDAALGAALLAGGLLVAIGGNPPIIETAIIAVLTNSDIVMGLNSNLKRSREVMSHEYGHYSLCDMLTDANEFADDYIIWSTIGNGDTLQPGVRYMNEAFADFVTANVVGGADYQWLQNASPIPPPGPPAGRGEYPLYCFSDLDDPADPTDDNEPTCWDENLRADPQNGGDPAGIGRIATLLMDAFDGHPAAARNTNAYLPGNGDVWRQINTVAVPPDTRLELSPTNYLAEDDGVLENVHVRGSAIRAFANVIADDLPAIDFGGEDIDDERIYRAVNAAMMTQPENNWCERCRVLALHRSNLGINPGDETRVNLIHHCLSDNLTRAALQTQPPAPNGNFNYETCEPCPAGQVADASGVCAQCPADVTLDGSTINLGAPHVFDPTSVQAPGDVCPTVFWVQVNNPQLAVARGSNHVTGFVGPIFPLTGTLAQMETTCERSYQLLGARQTATGFVPEPTLTQTALFTCSGLPGQPCTPNCSSLPTRNYDATFMRTGNAVRFGTSATNSTIRLSVSAAIGPG